MCLRVHTYTYTLAYTRKYRTHARNARIHTDKWKTMEKWQGQNVEPYTWEEDAWVAAAKQIKDINPDIAVVVWFDSFRIYTVREAAQRPPINKSLLTLLLLTLYTTDDLILQLIPYTALLGKGRRSILCLFFFSKKKRLILIACTFALLFHLFLFCFVLFCFVFVLFCFPLPFPLFLLLLQGKQDFKSRPRHIMHHRALQRRHLPWDAPQHAAEEHVRTPSARTVVKVSHLWLCTAIGAKLLDWNVLKHDRFGRHRWMRRRCLLADWSDGWYYCSRRRKGVGCWAPNYDEGHDAGPWWRRSSGERSVGVGLPCQRYCTALPCSVVYCTAHWYWVYFRTARDWYFDINVSNSIDMRTCANYSWRPHCCCCVFRFFLFVRWVPHLSTKKAFFTNLVRPATQLSRLCNGWRKLLQHRRETVLRSKAGWSTSATTTIAKMPTVLQHSW